LRGDLLSYSSHQLPFPFLNIEVINEVVVSAQVPLTRNLSFAIHGTSEAGLKLKMVEMLSFREAMRRGGSKEFVIHHKQLTQSL
jgi:hypothetical protein